MSNNRKKNHLIFKQRLLLIAIFCSGFSFFGFGQQPSYYQLGEEEFSGIDIYGLLQDREGYIWICSNNGLFRYNGYDYERFDHPAMKNQSVFNPKLDQNGVFHCNNLAGQFFRYEQDSLYLFYTLPDSLKSYNILYEFNLDNELIISSKNIHKLTKNKVLEPVMNNSGVPSSIHAYEDGSLLLYNFRTAEFKNFENGKLTDPDFPSVERLGIDHFGPYNKYTQIENDFYLFDPQEFNFLKFDGKTWIRKDEKIKERQGAIAYCMMNDLGLWIAHQDRGMRCYNYDGEALFNDQVILEEFQISAGCEDEEGNIWLGTLGKGLVIIPNRKMIDYNNHSLLNDDEIKSFTQTNDGIIICGGYNGTLYKIENGVPTVLYQVDNKIDFLHFDDNTKLLYYNNFIARLEKGGLTQIRQNRTSSIKDIYILNNSESLVATNVHPYIHRFDNKDSSFTKLFQSFPSFFHQDRIDLNGFEIGRSNAIYFDEKLQEVWVATLNGIMTINKNEIMPVEYDGKILGVLKMIEVNGEIWVGTSKQGILIFKDKKFVRHLNENTGLLSDYLIKMKRFGDQLIVSTDQGVEIMSLSSDEKIRLNKANGLLSNRVLDFTLKDNELWLTSNKGIQKILLDEMQPTLVQPNINLNHILVNEKPVDQNVFSFDHNENKFEFAFMSLAYSHRGSLIYEYRLLGHENEWNSTTYELNSAKYSSLSPGNYTFEVRAVNEHQLVSETASYSFEILPPFWNTWWFYVITVLLIIGVVATYFLIRISIIRNRLQIEKQLKASEVTAIKAQMNPHFVFNALNSVQDLILQNDIRESNIYLGKFSDLMRKTLEYSSREHISIHEEINLLKLYLDLEKLRFGDDFQIDFKIELSETDTHDYQIPSMILQPYVENATKHGLLHKSGIKRLTISFKKSNDHILAEIRDNGIGRSASQEIQKRQSNHQSFASSATQKRIDLVNEINPKKINLSIKDLYENDQAAGTLVIIQFPLKK